MIILYAVSFKTREHQGKCRTFCSGCKYCTDAYLNLNQRIIMVSLGFSFEIISKYHFLQWITYSRILIFFNWLFNLQVYIDCLARESRVCQAKNFTDKILSIASGLKGDGECPNLQLAALRSPDLVSPRLDIPYPRRNSRTEQEPQQISGRYRNEPSPPMYGSGNKQDFENPDLMFPDEIDTGSSSSAYSNTEDSKSNTNKGRPSRTNTNYHNTEETTTLEAELLQLHYAERDSQSKSDNAQSATPSWQFTTQRMHHRHRHHHTSRHASHHTSHQTQSTEQLQPLHIRQVRSSTTKSK